LTFEEERALMVSRQLKGRGIHDPGVLGAMGRVPRHLFVPESRRSSAYGDFPLPIGDGQTISQPYMVAIMTQSLDLTGAERVLEIGTGSGYQAAVLAEMVREVVSVERISQLADRANARLVDLGYSNVEVCVSDGTLGWPQRGPYQGIMVTAGAPYVPKPLQAQLDIGGRLVIPVGERHSQVLEIHTKVEEERFKIRQDTACRFVDLIGEHGW
jgi:protein-L-isoaspartate(D-aspartate) O-methyltransferase